MAFGVYYNFAPVLFPEFVRDGGCQEEDKFRSGEHIIEVEVLDVHASRACVGCRDDVVNQALGSNHFCYFGGLVSWEVNEVATYCVSDSVGVCFVFL